MVAPTCLAIWMAADPPGQERVPQHRQARWQLGKDVLQQGKGLVGNGTNLLHHVVARQWG